MSYERFRNVSFRPASLDRIRQCNAIITSYQAMGLRLTLRQLYYQLVTKNLIENVERSYKALSSLVSDARLAGLMDWDAIEDRVRQPKSASEFDDLEELTEAALAAYRLPRWRDQQNYVELWVEKDALAGVLWPIARDVHITLMVNRGYSSQSAMYESAHRFAAHTDKSLHLLYLGDLDPSGEDMVRDVRERIAMFGQTVAVTKIALTAEQVAEYKPPPNPAKLTDPRAHAYIKKHGAQSWEVDALPPDVLDRLVRAELSRLVDDEEMDAVIAREERDKQLLRDAVQNLGGAP